MADRERTRFGSGVLQAAEDDGRSQAMMTRAALKYLLPFLAFCGYSIYKLFISG